MKTNPKSLSVALATIAMVCLAAPVAHAVLTLHLDDNNGNTATAVDADGDGLVVFNGGLGSWIVNVSTGISKPILGSDERPKLEFNTVNTSRGIGVKTLTITLSDTFSNPLSGGVASLIGGVTHGSFSGVASTSTAGPFASHGPLGPGAFADTTGGTLPAGPYTLVLETNTTHGAGTRVTSFDWMVCQVPDSGASIALFGIALLCLGGVHRKLHKAA